MVALSPELLEEQADALDSVLDAITREHYAAELEALSDREEELRDRQDAILEECRLAVELLIADGVNLERPPTPDEVERVLEDAHRLLNPPQGIVTEASIGQVTELFDWSVSVLGEAGNKIRVLDPRIKAQLSVLPERQPTGRPNGRPEHGENRPDLIAARLRSGVDQLWTIDELRECVAHGGPVPRALRWRRMVLGLVIANMRDARGHDKCAPQGIAEALDVTSTGNAHFASLRRRNSGTTHLSIAISFRLVCTRVTSRSSALV
jgi:hypothetical protein